MLTIILFLVTLQAPSQQKKPDPPTQSEQTQEITRSDTRGSESNPLVIKNAPSVKTEREAEDEARQKDAKERNDSIALGTSIITLLVLIIQTIVFGLQAHRLKQTIEAMKDVSADQSKDMQASIAVARQSADAATKSADAAKASSEATIKALQNLERPALFVEVVMLRQNPTAHSHIEYIIHNHGRATAIITEACIDAVVMTELPEVSPYEGQESHQALRDFAIKPGRKAEHIQDVRGFHRAVRDSVQQGKSELVFSGIIKYTDAFQEHFFTKFFFLYRPRDDRYPHRNDVFVAHDKHDHNKRT